ncbi:hypothetical protein BC834DRAFT_843819 [Gloeopeniophorella convolvens]|nr:hypothetical protein BC834DRAFT_843819 [Gloeopeniophorella convolvens]
MVSYDPSALTSQFRLFHRQSSKLRKMRLYSIHIPWAYFPKRTLTHLEIFFVTWGTTPIVPRLGSLDDLLDVITNSPCLEQLTLNNCLAPVSSQPTLAETVTEMPLLCRLDLSGPGSSVLRIFQSLHAPVLRALTLLFIATNQAEAASWPTAAPFVLSRFHRTRPVTIKTLSLEVYTDHMDTKIGVWGHHSLVTPAVLSLPLYETFVSLEFHLPNVRECHEAVWQEACAALHMVELKSVHVSVPTISDIEPARWTRFFDRCTSVTKVYVRGSDGAESLLLSMMPRDPTPPVAPQDLDEPAPALLFPKLTRLFLEGFYFESCYSDAGCLYEIILKLIERRERCGAPFKELYIRSCVASPDEAASLEALVPRVRWDLKAHWDSKHRWDPNEDFQFDTDE